MHAPRPLLAIVAALCVAQYAPPVRGAQDCVAAQVSEIAPGIYVRPGRHAPVFEAANIANAGFVAGERCVAVIDTGGSVAEGEALACAVARLTRAPVCYVINTHVHPDHVLGNPAFRGPGVRFVGHRDLARALALVGGTYLQRASRHAGRPLGAEHIVGPDIEVGDTLDLDLGGRVLRLTAHGAAHTDSDLSVYDPQTRTLWLGDLLFLQHVPVLDGSVNGWLEVLAGQLRLPALRVVAGHGPAQSPWPEAAHDTRRYLQLLRDETRAWLATGGDLRGAQEQVGWAERERWQLFTEYHRRNVATAVAELEWED